uniref:FeoB-associated Cys-rich membrane protein n=1 Tax=Desulfomonile tiedjei TaxID=2358 RepID=A0A7C4AQK8_9BACT
MIETIVIALIVAVALFVVGRFAVRSLTAQPKCSSCAACKLAGSCDHLQSSDAAHPGK